MIEGLESLKAGWNSAGVDLGQADMSKAEIVYLLEHDGRFFIEFFLGDQLEHEVPDLHLEIWDRLTAAEMFQVLLAIPRGHAKTTLVKLAVLWHFMFTLHRFTVYVSNTNAIALNACKDIMAFMECDNFRAVFGNVTIIKKSETDSLWQFKMPMKDGTDKFCILRAVGANQQMRGINIDNQRPDLAAIDDLESNENTNSPILQKNLDIWVFGTFLKALARGRVKVFWLGNMLTKESLLSRLSVDPDWHPVVFGAIIVDPVTLELRPLWPDLWSMEQLRIDFQKYVRLGLIETWMCEMMNMPGHGVNGFSTDQVYIQQVPLREELRGTFLTLDPAFGLKQENDNSAIAAHGIRDDGLPIVLEVVAGKFTEAEIFEHMIQLRDKWGAKVWGMEAIAAQRVLISLFQLLLAQRNELDSVEMIPLISGGESPKYQRIKAFVGLMAKKEYALYEGCVDVVTEIFSYDVRKKKNVDDRIDSCAYGPTMIEQYLDLILSAANNIDKDESVQVIQGMEVTGNV